MNNEVRLSVSMPDALLLHTALRVLEAVTPDVPSDIDPKEVVIVKEYVSMQIELAARRGQ